MSKAASKLVRNKATAKASKIQSMVVNFLPKSCRIDTMEGREFVVVPMVILTEGVHAGSDGPLYYSPEELSKTPACWNHKPIVVYHPEMNGEGVSACSPAIITNRKVGVMMNTVYEKGRLKSEAWIEKPRADLVDNRIMEAINNSEMMEVSTGVFIDMEAEPGKWNGEDYTGIARNFRPDHLALLPDKIGACSIADGAGLLRNQDDASKKILLAKAVHTILQHLGPVANEMSFSNIQDSIVHELKKKLGVTDNGPWPWIAAAYSNFFIYEWQNKFWRLGFTSSDTGITLSDIAPVEVVRVTEWRTVNGSFVGNQINQEQFMKKTIIDQLIANTASSFVEADRAKLEALSEAQLTTMQKALAPPAPAPVVAPAVVPAPAAAAPAAPATNAAPVPAKVVSVEEYIAAAPKGIAEVLTNGVSAYNAEKEALITQLTANAGCPFTKEELNNRPLGELRSLVKLAGIAAPAAENIVAPNFGGQAPVPATNKGAVEEPMTMPTMNFGKKTAAA